jgi:raffinose/stachyose/melibiose transport system substrate-binding protein
MIQQSNRGFRRLRLLVAVPAVGALMLAGCGGGGDGGDGGDGDGDGGSGGAADSFTFGYPADPAGESPFETLAKEYSADTGVEVETTALPGEQYGVTIRTQLQGGQAPDTLVVAPGSGQDQAVLPLAEAGLLQPLNETSASVVTEESRDLVYFEDQLYAQPTDLVAVGMIWNPTAASDAGVEYPEDIDQLLDSCPALADAGKSFFALAGSAPPNVGLMAQSIAATRVYAEDPDWNQQRADGDVTFADSAGWQDTLQTVLDLNETTGCFQPGAAGGGFDAITNGIAQATSLAAFTPGGAANELMNNVPGLTLEIRPFPPASGGQPYIFASPNYALAIAEASDDPQKQAAQEFLDWLTEPENAQRLAEVAGNVPVVGVEEATLPPQYEPVKTMLVDGDYVPLPSNLWPNPSVYDALSTGAQGLLSGQGDIDSVLQAMDQAWDQ